MRVEALLSDFRLETPKFLLGIEYICNERAARDDFSRPSDVDQVLAYFRRIITAEDCPIFLALSLHFHSKATYSLKKRTCDNLQCLLSISDEFLVNPNPTLS